MFKGLYFSVSVFCFCLCIFSFFVIGSASYPAAAPLCGLLRWYSTSSTVQTAPLTFSTRMKHLWRDKLCRTAFYIRSHTSYNTRIRTQFCFAAKSVFFISVFWSFWRGLMKKEKRKNTMQLNFKMFKLKKCFHFILVRHT